jgi:hypothetical protein
VAKLNSAIICARLELKPARSVRKNGGASLRGAPLHIAGLWTRRELLEALVRRYHGVLLLEDIGERTAHGGAAREQSRRVLSKKFLVSGDIEGKGATPPFWAGPIQARIFRPRDVADAAEEFRPRFGRETRQGGGRRRFGARFTSLSCHVRQTIEGITSILVRVDQFRSSFGH